MYTRPDVDLLSHGAWLIYITSFSSFVALSLLLCNEGIVIFYLFLYLTYDPYFSAIKIT
jgi:hypothetical protein